MNYIQTSVVRLVARFIDIEGIAIDPTTVTVRVRTPSAVTTSYTLAGGQVIRAALGQFYYDLTLSASGSWIYQWEGAGAVVAVGGADITVVPTQI